MLPALWSNVPEHSISPSEILIKPPSRVADATVSLWEDVFKTNTPELISSVLETSVSSVIVLFPLPERVKL